MTKTPTYTNIGQILISEVPELAADHEEAMFNGELMMHVFFGYVAGYVQEQTRLYMAGDEQQGQILQKLSSIFGIMTRALRSNCDKLIGAVMASFLEGLDTPDAGLFRVMVGMMSDEMKDAVKELQEFYHSPEWRTFMKRLDG